MFARMTNLIAFFCLLAPSAFASELPSQPKSVEHPGSDAYEYGVVKEAFQHNRRNVSVYLPNGEGIASGSIPVVVFGAGQASPEEAYEDTFVQLAAKGVAVIFPKYDNGFFDRDWRRMGADYANLAQEAANRFSIIDRAAVVFSGHSKGAYVASVAAGLGVGLQPAAVVLIQPAGYDSRAWADVKPSVPVTVIASDADDIIDESLVREIYQASAVRHKQFMMIKSYTMTNPQLPADHFFCFSKDTWIGGRDGISPFHYYGLFGWLIGAAKDLQSEEPISNPFIYGNEAVNTGVAGFRHEVTRSW